MLRQLFISNLHLFPARLVCESAQGGKEDHADLPEKGNRPPLPRKREKIPGGNCASPVQDNAKPLPSHSDPAFISSPVFYCISSLIRP